MAAQGDRVLLEDGAGLRWWTPATGETRMVPGRRALAVGETLIVVCVEDCRTVDVLDRDAETTCGR